MLNSLKIIIEETLEVYNLATLGGALFIPFFLCLVYLLFTSVPEDESVRRYLVYPSLVLMLFLFNPVFIHLLYKFIAVPERIVRIYWPLPMDLIFIYCLIRLFATQNKRWKKAALLLMTLLLLFVGAKGHIAGAESYGKADNALKMPKGTREIADQLFVLNNYEPVNVIMPTDLFFWSREYCYYIRIPYARDMDEMETEDGVLDLHLVGQAALQGDCPFVVLNDGSPVSGDLADYGFAPVSSVPTQHGSYTIYKRS